MSVINVLDISVANLISAGEVVERPSSAIKELCENSMDAGAKNITVEIQNGGIALMRVTDDGCGMSGEDAVLCIKRHATSKIKDAKDLNKILTLGFRGEALAAITAVTNARIMTKRKEDQAGTLLRCEYGTVTEISEGGYPNGTTVICEKLFARTQPRLKFLKSDAAEGAACAQAVERLALSHPEVSYKFISDGVLKLSTPGDGNLLNAIYAVYGREFSKKLLEVNSKSGGVAVQGYIGVPDNCRGNRLMQVFFVNHRSVKSAQMTAALESAYRTHIMVNKFPVCVLNVQVNPMYVDVNIHPSKMEVKFSEEKAIFDSIYYTVRGVLERDVKRFNLELPEEKITEEEKKAIDTLTMPRVPETVPAPKQEVEKPKAKEEVKFEKPGFEPKQDELNIKETYKARYSAINIEKDDDEPELPRIPQCTDAKLSEYKPLPVPEYRIVGEVFRTYVIVETKNEMIMIDKHAAHERINYEKLRAQYRQSKPDTQLLLVPHKMMLNDTEAVAAKENKAAIEKLGYTYDLDGKTMAVTGIPSGTDIKEAEGILASLIDASVSGESLEEVNNSHFEKVLYTVACKASIKGGREYDEQTLKWIIDNVFRYDCIKNCPHGRTIGFVLSERDLNVRFGRED